MHLMRKPPRVFYGWWVLGACFVITVYSAGVVFFSFTALFEPIAGEFGWNYAQISIAASLRGLEMGLFAPLVGLLVDRWGPRRLMFTGAIITSLGLMLLSRVTSLGMFYGAFIIIALGSSTTIGTVAFTAIANWFREKVGIASGILASGFAIGGFLIPLTTTLIDRYEWRPTIVILALGMLCITLPLSLVVRHKPEQYGYLPDGKINSVEEDVGKGLTLPGNDEEDIGPKQALKSSAFWHMSLAFLYHSMVTHAVNTHVMPYLSSVGIERSISSLLAAALVVASIGGRIGFGWLAGRTDRKRLSVIAFVMLGLGLLVFGYLPAGGIWLIVPFIIFFSIGWGGNVTMRVALVREIFGRKRFGTMHGFTVGVMMIGGLVGAPIAGWVFDTRGSYQPAWFAFAGLAVAAIVILKTGPPVGRTE